MSFSPEGEWKLEIGFMTLEQSQHYVANHLSDWKKKGITYMKQVKR